VPRQFDPKTTGKVLALLLGSSSPGERASALAPRSFGYSMPPVSTGAICCCATISTGSTMQRAGASMIDCIRYGLSTMTLLRSIASSSSGG
jgi:hypothetical protein